MRQLTERELRVLRLLTSDLSERGIGRELYVSHNTVHSHVRSIYRKLGVSSRARALERTRELKLLPRAISRQEWDSYRLKDRNLGLIPAEATEE